MKRTPIQTRRGPDCFKHEDHWLAEALGATWSRRRGYTVASPNRANQYALLRDAGFGASRRYFGRDKTPYHFDHEAHPGEKFTLNQALALAAYNQMLAPDTERVA